MATTDRRPADYPIWSITIQGFVWGNRGKSAADTIAEVERIMRDSKEAHARCPKYEPTWLFRWTAFDDDGRSIVTRRAAVVEIEAGSTVYYKGPTIARWVGGERVL